MRSEITNIQLPNVIVSLESLNQGVSTAACVVIVPPTTQSELSQFSVPGIVAEVPITPIEHDPDVSRPRTPGAGKGRILRIASDF
jgi:hypothetical protein